MTDIAALLTDPTLRPALIGFAGVGIGALVTVTGQGMGRRAERLHKVKEEVAVIIGHSHMIRSLLSAFHTQTTPEDVGDRYLESLNIHRPDLYKSANVLCVTAPWPIAAAAIHLAETHTAFDTYAHPALGAGKELGFPDINYYVREVMQSEDVLTKTTRAPGYWRWPALVGARLKSKRRSQTLATSVGTAPARAEQETTQP